MFCGKCGTQNEEGVMFCANCGEPLSSETQTEQVAPTPKKPAMSNKTIGMIAVGVAAAIVVIIIASILLGGSGAKAVAEKFVKATAKPDFGAMIDLLHDDVAEEYKENMLEWGGYDDDEWKDLVKDYNDEMEDSLEDTVGDDWKLKIKSVKEDDLSKKKLKALKEYYDDEYDLKVTDAKEIEMDTELKGDDDDVDEEITIIVVKIGGKWYVDMSSSIY